MNLGANTKATDLRITGLFTYPIKSCAAISHQRIEVERFGLAWDRRWMLVDADGKFITQRSVPWLALVTPTVTDMTLEITARGFSPLLIPLRSPLPRAAEISVTVWEDQVVAWDEGETAARWFSEFARTQVRLVRFPDAARRVVNPHYSTVTDATTAFADGFPMLLATEESLAELNRRLVARGASPIPMNRFRPNIVLAGADRAFAEDDWVSLRCHHLQLDLVKPCSRCVITTTDQLTGNIPEPGEPLATLNTFRRWEGKVAFAQNVVAHGTGVLAVGDPVEILHQGTANRWGIARTAGILPAS